MQLVVDVCLPVSYTHLIKDLSAVVTGLILALNLPSTVPLWLPVIGCLLYTSKISCFHR